MANQFTRTTTHFKQSGQQIVLLEHLKNIYHNILIVFYLKKI